MKKSLFFTCCRVMFQKEHLNFDDEELYRYARLVTSAVIAKVHTIDWTIELLKTDTLHAAMRANWYGLLGKEFKDSFGHVGGWHWEVLVPMGDLVGLKGEKTLSEIGFTKQFVSMGHQSCGALTLWNYPMWLRDLIPQGVDGKDRPDHVDMPALEVYRDRENKVARYNEFRRGLLMIPISKWGDLTDDPEVVHALREVYGDDVEELDLLVGLMAEKKIKGFSISETAFTIFLLMATRRLEGDRFFTSYYNEETYTKR
ncbi:hypothetical protein GIB67_008005, partial [Kingdonia uniflora]